MHSQQQVGDYVIYLRDLKDCWRVKMAGAEEDISVHNTEKEAMAAVKRYQAEDARRRRQKN
jgi:hypothetical protein